MPGHRLLRLLSVRQARLHSFLGLCKGPWSPSLVVAGASHRSLSARFVALSVPLVS